MAIPCTGRKQTELAFGLSHALHDGDVDPDLVEDHAKARGANTIGQMMGGAIDAVREPDWWARTVSNRRPLVCKGTGESEHAFYGVYGVQVKSCFPV